MPQEKFRKFRQNDKNYSVNPIFINNLLNLLIFKQMKK